MLERIGGPGKGLPLQLTYSEIWGPLDTLTCFSRFVK
jgi:hypothetical protein